jgi:N-carbamoylputrescine amidase
LLYPTAIGWDPHDDEAEQQRQLDAWITVQRGHAIANGIPLAACNRVGFEPAPDAAQPQPGIRFWGSFLCLRSAGRGARPGRRPDAEDLLITEIDLARGEQVRRIWPFLRDRRIDAYGDLLRRWRD